MICETPCEDSAVWEMARSGGCGNRGKDISVLTG